MFNNSQIGLFIGIACLIFVLFLYFKFIKHINCGCITLITGGVKTGKSTLSVAESRRTYYIVLFKWYIKAFFCKIFRKPIPEKPLYYSNVPIKVKNFRVLELEHLLRLKRFNYKSVVYIQEAALVCDSMLIKDKNINNALSTFFKLFGHETRGGKLFIDTQAICDTHFSLKRSLSNYIYIHHIKKIPFFVICYVREMIHSEDNSAINVFNNDIETDLKRIIVPKSTWKKFDCYSFSSLTDFLVHDGVLYQIKNDKDLKVDKVVSFRPEFNMSVSDLKLEQQRRIENEKERKES